MNIWFACLVYHKCLVFTCVRCSCAVLFSLLFTFRPNRVLDAPGHANYVPDMINGAAQADIGVLVISARRGEFEAGFERQGQVFTFGKLCWKGVCNFFRLYCCICRYWEHPFNTSMSSCCCLCVYRHVSMHCLPRLLGFAN